MKRPTFLLTALTVFASMVLPVVPAAAASPNLLANPSVETASGALPANWRADKWGTNTATQTYENTGRTGAKSLKVNMTARTDGDAKWMADAVTVAGNKSYTYTSYYKSNVATEIDLQYQDAAGNFSYAYVQTVPASADWTEVKATFTTPANAVKVSVMHIVASVGWLQTDDFTLSETEVLPPAPEPTPGANLIANPSFETASGTVPASWNKNNWGTNTSTFTYANTGRTGSKSAQVTVSAYTNGDAKWYANFVNASPGQAYTYTDWYKSGVTSRVVVATQDSAGAFTYKEIASATASTNWKQYTATFTVPINAAKVSVYHLISQKGTLTLDDVSLIKAAPSIEPVPNASLETASPANPSAPDQWTSNSWGTNSPTFEYTNDGRTGSKSVKVTMANYVDGDAKWYFNPIDSLQKGKQYRLTAWYKTNVIPKAVAMFTKADGSVSYFGLPNPQPTASAATSWTKYSDTFSVPLDAVSTSVFFFINENGWLQTDDYSITPYTPTGFNRPLLTLTFDDGHEDNVANALPVLNQLDLKTTHCFATDFVEHNPEQAINNVMAFYNSGHEICSHTVSHPALTSLNATNLTYELQHSQQYLQSLIGRSVPNFASPFGDYNAAVNTEIKKYYRSHRTVDEGYNSKDNFDIYRLRVQNIFSTTTAAQVQAWIGQAQADKTWLILVYHRVANDPGQYDSYVNDFTAQMNVVKQSGITVKTYNDALDEITAQL